MWLHGPFLGRRVPYRVGPRHSRVFPALRPGKATNATSATSAPGSGDFPSAAWTTVARWLVKGLCIGSKPVLSTDIATASIKLSWHLFPVWPLAKTPNSTIILFLTPVIAALASLNQIKGISQHGCPWPACCSCHFNWVAASFYICGHDSRPPSPTTQKKSPEPPY